jgi:peptidoglycan/LPS O-acetylase OafA/YrhL
MSSAMAIFRESSEHVNVSTIDGAAESLPRELLRSERIAYLDHLRVLLTVLVVLHHVAVMYSDLPLFYYTEPPKDSSGRLLDYFLLFNQMFFMGFFFLIAGYFTPGSCDRKGGRAYMKGRLVRLGIPLLAFILVLRPILLAGLYPTFRAAAAEQGTKMSYWLFYFITWNPGPMWFVEVLLVLSFLYVLVRTKRDQRMPHPSTERSARRGRTVVMAGLVYAVLLAVMSYLWRIIVPVGQYWPLVGLPTPAFLPQYVSLFVLGVWAYRGGWLGALPRWAGAFGFVQAVVFGYLLSRFLHQKANAGMPAWLGHGTWQSLGFALWESLFAVSVIVALLVLFRECVNGDGPLGRFLARQSYGVYVLHPLVLVALGHAFAGMHPIAVVKFGVVAVFAIPLCWALAYLVRTVPIIRRIL